jgi:hypothetical protein
MKSCVVSAIVPIPTLKPSVPVLGPKSALFPAAEAPPAAIANTNVAPANAIFFIPELL